MSAHISYVCMYWPFSTKYTEQATITAFERIFHFWKVLEGLERLKYTEEATITAFQRIFHFWNPLKRPNIQKKLQ